MITSQRRKKKLTEQPTAVDKMDDTENLDLNKKNKQIKINKISQIKFGDSLNYHATPHKKKQEIV